MSDRVHFLGTRPVLPYRVNQVPLDGDMNKVRTIDQSPDGGVDTESAHSGRPCQTEHFPTKVEWQGPADTASIGDFSTGESGVFHVSTPAKEFIEALEPDVHQFVPFDMMAGGEPLERRFWWVIGNRLDSVDREGTNYVLLGGRMWRPAKNVAESFPEYLPAGTDTESPPRLVFSAGQVGEALVWRDIHIDTGGPLVSQTFADALTGSNLTGYVIGEIGPMRI